MRRTVLTALSVLLLAAPSRAQNLIDKLEKDLGAKAGAVAAEPQAAAPTFGYFGYTPDEDYKGKDGVKVLAVTPGGPAETAGLKKGDLIKSVDGKIVGSFQEMDELQTTTKPNQTWRLMIERAGKLQMLNVKLGTRPAVAAGETDPGEAPPAAPALNPPTPGLPALSPPVTPPGISPSTSPPAASPPAASPPAAGPSFSPLDPLSAPGAAPAAGTPSGAPIRSRPLDLGTPPAGAGGEASATPLPASPAPATEAPAADALPGPAAPAGSGATLGITVVPLSPEARGAYGVSTTRGALVTAVRAGSPADTAGIPIGAVIVIADGRRIDSADDLVGFVRAARAGQEVELSYYQGGNLQRKLVKLGPSAAGVVPGAPAAPGGYGYGPGSSYGPAGTGRPLINSLERIVDGVTSGRGPSTVYNPLEMATLRKSVEELTAQVKALEERIRVLEGRGAPPAGPTAGLGAP